MRMKFGYVKREKQILENDVVGGKSACVLNTENKSRNERRAGVSA